MSGWKMNGNSGLSLKMRQPLPIMMNIATALIQCVMRTISGWIFLWRCTGAIDTLAMARLSSVVVSARFVRSMPEPRIAHHSILSHFGVWMAYAPAGSREFFAGNLPAGIGLIETVDPNFGACLFRAADLLLAAGHEGVCLLNSDSPTLPTGYLVAAATALAAPGDRVVLGPATDGGYYLIGIKQPHRRLFQDVDWSTERVLRQTLARADELGLPVVVLPSWYDVDCEAALRVLIGELVD